MSHTGVNWKSLMITAPSKSSLDWKWAPQQMRCHLPHEWTCTLYYRWCADFRKTISNADADINKLCPNNLRTRSSSKEYRNQINQSKGLQIYWHQSEGIRPPFNHVDSVLLELPYDGLIVPLLIYYLVLTIFYSAIASPGQQICHLGWREDIAIQGERPFPSRCSHSTRIRGACRGNRPILRLHETNFLCRGNWHIPALHLVWSQLHRLVDGRFIYLESVLGSLSRFCSECSNIMGMLVNWKSLMITVRTNVVASCMEIKDAFDWSRLRIIEIK